MPSMILYLPQQTTNLFDSTPSYIVSLEYCVTMLFNTVYLCALFSLFSPVMGKIAAGTGKYSVTVNGVNYNPAAGKSAKVDKLSTCTGKIQVRGIHTGYDIDCATLAVSDYTLTGTEDAQSELKPP